MIKHLASIIAIAFACVSICQAASESLINIRPNTSPTLMPGATIVLPDGSQTVIVDRLSDGRFLTSGDLVISSRGVLESGSRKGEEVRVLESGFTPGAIIRLPNGEETTIAERLADGQLTTENGLRLTSDGKLTEGEFSGKSATIITPGYVPGALVKLPDGSTTEISELLADGSLKTKAGAILTKDGKLASGEDKGEKAELARPAQKLARAERAAQDKESAGQTNETRATPGPQQATGGRTVEDILAGTPAKRKGAAGKQAEGSASQSNETGASPGPQQQATGGRTIEDILAGPSATQAGTAGLQADGSGAGNESLEDILAMSPDTGAQSVEDILGAMPAVAENEHTGKQPGQGSGAGAQKGKTAGQLKAEGSSKARAEARTKAEASGKSASKSESGSSRASKTRAGQELRIPPDAAKTGNLDFLEGCWQGTRPEYNTKRIIRECFCFSAGGRSGKRRIFDPGIAGMCVGATRATLSRDGVLSVHSAGAACTSGDRWGQAEMVCRNSGPRTPCSWVFRDANYGRQAYEIPFVRVNSCTR